MRSSPHVPILRDLSLSILEKTSRWDVHPSVVDEEDHYNPTRSARFGGEIVPNCYTYAMLEEIYGVTYDDLVDLEEQLRSSDFFPMFISSVATHKAISCDDL
jgi:hypothetical protein